MLVIHAEILIQPEHVESFLQLADPFVNASQAEAGNIRYTLMADFHQSNLFTMIEEWESQEAVTAHEQSAHFLKYVDDTKDMTAAPLKVKMYEVMQLPVV
jgi:quinol monooxygenase YgiN